MEILEIVKMTKKMKVKFYLVVVYKKKWFIFVWLRLITVMVDKIWKIQFYFYYILLSNLNIYIFKKIRYNNLVIKFRLV